MNTNADDIRSLRVQRSLSVAWNEIGPKAETRVFGTIEEAVDFSRDLAGQKHNVLEKDRAPVVSFVTDSMHLAGGFLDVIETKPYTENT